MEPGSEEDEGPSLLLPLPSLFDVVSDFFRATGGAGASASSGGDVGDDGSHSHSASTSTVVYRDASGKGKMVVTTTKDGKTETKEVEFGPGTEGASEVGDIDGEREVRWGESRRAGWTFGETFAHICFNTEPTGH